MAPTNASAARGKSQFPATVSAIPARAANWPGCRIVSDGLGKGIGSASRRMISPSTISFATAGVKADDVLRWMAPLGHASRQTRHSLHSAKSIVDISSFVSRLIAPVGQTSTQSPHPVHLVRSIYTKTLTSSSLQDFAQRSLNPSPMASPPDCGIISFLGSSPLLWWAS